VLSTYDFKEATNCWPVLWGLKALCGAMLLRLGSGTVEVCLNLEIETQLRHRYSIHWSFWKLHSSHNAEAIDGYFFIPRNVKWVNKWTNKYWKIQGYHCSWYVFCNKSTSSIIWYVKHLVLFWKNISCKDKNPEFSCSL